MGRTGVFHIWDNVSRDNWSYRSSVSGLELIVFEIDMLPNFSEPRFYTLGEKLEERCNEIVKKQMKMLMQMHSLGEKFAISLRLRRDQNRLRLFVVIRYIDIDSIESAELAYRVSSMFPHEYTINRINLEEDKALWELATDLNWVGYVAEIFKKEDVLNANTSPFFYVAPIWQPVVNDMELLCRALLKNKADSMVEITIVPTKFDRDERDWLDNTLKRMKDAQMGERIYGENNRLLKSFEPMPGLRMSTENSENVIKRYGQSRLFLSSLKVFSTQDPSSIVQAFITGATKTDPQIHIFNNSDSMFKKTIEASSILDINPEIHTKFWDEDFDTRPFRAQRMQRLIDLEEVSCFWRFPIPVKNGFPGFVLDTGLKQSSNESKTGSYDIELGYFNDDSVKARLPASFDRQQLAKHGLIVGVPGSGKTTAIFNILHQLWANKDKEQRIPFIVLEPAKTEFRALKNISQFRDDMLVFTLGDERISPFRFNPLEILSGISLESHISKLNACFTGAFNLFDPLPMLLDKAIRQTYRSKGWFDDSIGGEKGVEMPTLSDLCKEADEVVRSSGYSNRLNDDIRESLLQRLESLRRGSKGRMLDVKQSISFDDLMNKPVVLELDALNEDEKALLMMFILTFVFEYSKATRKSGSPLKHLLVIEEAHNLIGRGEGGSSEYRANPKEQSIRLFTRMLAELRALGEGILISDQLPTAIAPEAIKQTNLKILMRLTAKDDREEIGNTMDISEADMKNVIHFQSGNAYTYLECWDRVRMVNMINYKEIHKVQVPQDNNSLQMSMAFFEENNPELFMPYQQCSEVCVKCSRRVRSQAESFASNYLSNNNSGGYYATLKRDKEIDKALSHGQTENSIYEKLSFCGISYCAVKSEYFRLKERYGEISSIFPQCAYIHIMNSAENEMNKCKTKKSVCKCKSLGHQYYLKLFKKINETGD